MSSGMPPTRRRRQKPSQNNLLLRSLSPECYIDLTVDSPVGTSIQMSINNYEDVPSFLRISGTTFRSAPTELTSYDTRPNNNNNNLQENVLDNTVVLDDTDSCPVVSLRSPPPVHNRSATPCLSCPICFEELLNTSVTAFTTKCGHIFCETCLKTALKTRKKCPMCLKAVDIRHCVRLHI